MGIVLLNEIMDYYMHKGHRVIDVDAHYLETLTDVAEYMEEPWKTRLLEGGLNSEKYFFPSGSGSRNKWGLIQREETKYPDEPTKPDQIPDIMRHLDVDATVLISHLMLLASNVEADDRRLPVFSRAHTEYMLDQVISPDDGVYSVVPLPYQDPSVAAEFIDDFSDEKGIVAGCVVTGVTEPPLGNRRYDPMYEAAVEADLPLIFHTGGSNLDNYHRKGYSQFLETHVLGFLESNLSEMTSLIVQGIPERYPSLDIAFMESGVFWIPMLMARLDEEYLKRPEEAPLLEKLPSEYMKGMYFGTQPFEKSVNESHLEHVFEMIDAENTLMYASDYPHWDYDRPTAISDLSFVSEEVTGRILGGNAQEVFGI